MKTHHLSMRLLKHVLLWLVTLMFLMSCGATRRASNTGDANSTVTTSTSSLPTKKGRLIETGVASWYGPNFNGRLTANGETFDMNGINFGLSVCYDLRFPELYRMYQESAVDVILAPSAFTLKTGEVHWQLLLQARAVENLCFVVASNQTGEHDNKRKTYGHSMFVGPWGAVLGAMGSEEGYINHSLNIEQINKIGINNNLPVIFPITNPVIFTKAKIE